MILHFETTESIHLNYHKTFKNHQKISVLHRYLYIEFKTKSYENNTAYNSEL